MEEVRGSIPLRSTFWDVLDHVGSTLGGVAAGEGSFFTARVNVPFASGAERRRFVFQVSMASRDRPLLVALWNYLGHGSLRDPPARRAGWEPMTTLTVNSHRAHLSATVPFAERFLLPCAKRRQFESWRDELLQYEVEHPPRRQRAICSVEHCAGFVRGRGLCRSHYYRATGY